MAVTQSGTSKLFGSPPTIPFASHAVTTTVDDPGGHVIMVTAAQDLNFGDLVFRNFGGGADKALNGAYYNSRFIGVVVGGDVTNGQATSDSSLVATKVASSGKIAVVQIDGVAYVGTDASAGFTYIGQHVIPGQTTAGAALAIDKNVASFIYTDPAFQIHGAGSTVGKTAQAAQCIIAGILGTAVSAADTAALSGTTANAKFALYECRSTGGANQTTAKGADSAALINAAYPAAPGVGVATYGVIIINPTGTGGFVGGTTALDDATVIPNAVYATLIARYQSLGIIVATGTGTPPQTIKMRIQPSR